MFSNLLFLILVLLLISQSPEGLEGNWQYSPFTAFLLGMGLYVFVLAMIYLQNRYLAKKWGLISGTKLFLANIGLLIFLIFYHFVLGSARIYRNIIYFPESDTIVLLFSLFLFFLGLVVFHWSDRKKRRGSQNSSVAGELRMLIPFAIPFLLVTVMVDILKRYPELDRFLEHAGSFIGMLIVAIVAITFFAGIMIFLPFWIQKIWQCEPLEDTALKKELEAVCRKAHFRHAGLKTWTVMNHALTAAIIGIIPRYRYIMFTKRLLHEMPGTSLEAILAHEIGHNYHKHLLIYPWIILGMSVMLGLFTTFVEPSMVSQIFWFFKEYRIPFFTGFLPIALFSIYAAIIALYFRFVFGFFSRLFERQADLYVFALKIPSQYLINALQHIGIATGESPNKPNWHHYNIRQRIEFLRKAEEDPKVIKQHHRYVKICLLAYTVLVAVCLYFLSY